MLAGMERSRIVARAGNGERPTSSAQPSTSKGGSRICVGVFSSLWRKRMFELRMTRITRMMGGGILDSVLRLSAPTAVQWGILVGAGLFSSFGQIRDKRAMAEGEFRGLRRRDASAPSVPVKEPGALCLFGRKCSTSSHGVPGLLGGAGLFSSFGRKREPRITRMARIAPDPSVRSALSVVARHEEQAPWLFTSFCPKRELRITRMARIAPHPSVKSALSVVAFREGQAPRLSTSFCAKREPRITRMARIAPDPSVRSVVASHEGLAPRLSSSFCPKRELRIAAIACHPYASVLYPHLRGPQLPRSTVAPGRSRIRPALGPLVACPVARRSDTVFDVLPEGPGATPILERPRATALLDDIRHLWAEIRIAPLPSVTSARSVVASPSLALRQFVPILMTNSAP